MGYIFISENTKIHLINCLIINELLRRPRRRRANFFCYASPFVIFLFFSLFSILLLLFSTVKISTHTHTHKSIRTLACKKTITHVMGSAQRKSGPVHIRNYDCTYKYIYIYFNYIIYYIARNIASIHLHFMPFL